MVDISVFLVYVCIYISIYLPATFQLVRAVIFVAGSPSLIASLSCREGSFK